MKKQITTNRIAFTLLVVVLLIQLLPVGLGATESFGVYKLNQAVNLVQTWNGTICNVSTIISPNSTVYAGDSMTKNGMRFNYTFTSTTELGAYNVCGDCDTTAWCADFIISSTGTQLEISQSIIYFVFLIASIGLFGLCLFYAVKLQWKNERDEEGYVIGVNELKYLKLFLIVMSYISLMFVSGLLRSVTANFIPELGVDRFFEWVFWIMLSFMYPLIVCSLIFALVIFLSNKKFQKALEHGLPIT